MKFENIEFGQQNIHECSADYYFVKTTKCKTNKWEQGKWQDYFLNFFARENKDEEKTTTTT